MDDKFNQWCIDQFGKEHEKKDYMMQYISIATYKIVKMDAEISELKNRIAELEKKK